MSDATNSSILSLYSSSAALPNKENLLRMIERESRAKYPHLHVRFFPDRYMQAKIIANPKGGVLQQNASQKLIDVLKSERFFPEEFTHHLVQCDSKLDAPQYVLINNELQKIGYQFVMKASIGSGFVSFWFRNESDSPRLDLPVFYALEILNKLHEKIMQIDFNNSVVAKEISSAKAISKESKKYYSREFKIAQKSQMLF